MKRVILLGLSILFASCGEKADRVASTTDARAELVGLIRQADAKADEFVDLWLRAKHAETLSDLRELSTQTTTTHVTGRWAKAEVAEAEAARVEMDRLSLALKARSEGEGSEMVASYFRRMETRKRIEALISELVTAENKDLVLQNLADAQEELNRQRP